MKDFLYNRKPAPVNRQQFPLNSGNRALVAVCILQWAIHGLVLRASLALVADKQPLKPLSGIVSGKP